MILRNKQARKRRKRPAPSTRCYVCGNRVASGGEWDHFPLPHECGGTNVEPICGSCHDLKDRFSLSNGDGIACGEAVAALLRLWGKADTDERLMIAKMARSCAVASHYVAERRAAEEARSPAEARAVQLIAALVADGMTTEQIAAELQARGAEFARGGDT